MKKLLRIAVVCAVAAAFLVGVRVLNAQSDADYETSYRNGDYKASFAAARKAIKTNSSDWRAHYYAGLGAMKTGREKDAVKHIEKAAALNPGDRKVLSSLALAYAIVNDDRAGKAASAVLDLDKDNAEAHYVLALLALRKEEFATAYDRASDAIRLSPKLGSAFLVRSQALVSSFNKQRGTILPHKHTRYELLNDAASDLGYFLDLHPKHPNASHYREYRESLRFFADYYAKNPPKQRNPGDPEPEPEPGSTPLRILRKQKTSYTEAARRAGVEGTVTLLVQFSETGTVGHILVTKSLGYGLDEQCIRAVRLMTFTPATKNGVPVAVVRPVSFGFDIE